MLRVFERWANQRFFDQNLMSGILAVLVGVDPVHPFVPVVDRQIGGDFPYN